VITAKINLEVVSQLLNCARINIVKFAVMTNMICYKLPREIFVKNNATEMKKKIIHKMKKRTRNSGKNVLLQNQHQPVYSDSVEKQVDIMKSQPNNAR